MSKREIKVSRIDLDPGTLEERGDLVASDEAVCLFINGEHYRTLMATPSMIEELAVGHLLGEGVIGSREELRSVEVEPGRVLVELGGEVDVGLLNMGRFGVITTACGSPSPPVAGEGLSSVRVGSGLEVEAERLWGMVRELNLRSLLFRETGGAHSAMLCDPEGRVLCFAEDVGRHNAVDKAIGAGALGGFDLGGCVLVSSGRQSGEIVLKAARVGVQVVASVAGPLASGVMVAEETGLTLVCFVRGRRMNVYTHPERVLLRKAKP